MKVLATADPLGGVFTYVVDLARALAPRGVRVVLATMGGPLSPAQVEAALSVPGLSLHESNFRLEWMDDPWDDVARAADWLSRLARAVRPDVIHHGGYAHAAVDLGAPAVVVAHSDVTTWWRAVKGEEAPSRYDRYRAAVKASLGAARAVIAPTAAFLGELTARYGPFRHARAIHHGVTVPQGAPAPKEPVVLAAGRLWDEAKNLAVLDEVAARIPWPVCIAGDARHPDGRVFSARRATLLGQLSRAELGGWMGRAAILCHPARYEPFGLVPLEAAARGAALVLGDIPTLREIWQDAAVYAPPDDPAAVAAAVERLAGDEALRAALGERALRRAHALTLARTADVTHALWREVVGAAEPVLAEAR